MSEALGSRPRVLAAVGAEVHPGELEQLQAFVAEVLGRGHGSTITLTCRIRLGNRLPIEMSLAAFETAGRVHLLALVGDRSEHRAPSVGD